MTLDPRLSTIATLKKLSSYQGEYNLYEMRICYEYDLDALMGSSARSDQEYVDAVASQIFPGLPVSFEAPSFGCSACNVRTNSAVLTGRNYDFKQDTSALLVRTNPKNAYASIACACLNNVGANMADESMESKALASLAPFLSLDGVNEKGVSIAVLTLDSEPTDQKTDRLALNTSLAIRLVLDRAASTRQAVDLLKSYDMHAQAGRDYHFFINDALGDSVVVEYDPRDPKRSLIATSKREITNYYALYADEVEPNTRNGNLGHGKERALAIADVLDENADSLSVDVAWEALRAASQEPNPDDITSNTQWSVVYDNTHARAQIVLRRNWNDVFEFVLNEEK